MTLSRPALLAIIAILVVACAVAVGGYMRERDKSHSVEIRVDERGMRIDGR